MKKIYFSILPLVFLAVLAACTSSSTTPLPALPEPKSTSTEPMPTSTEPMLTQLPTEPSQPATIVSPDTIADIDQFLEKMNKEQHLFNGIALVAKQGEILLLKAYGMADPSKGKSLQVDTPMPIGSFAGVRTATLLLEEQGKLSLDDSICKYLNECPETWQPIKIRDVFDSRSGIPDPYIGLTDQEAGELWSRQDVFDELIRLVMDQPLQPLPTSGIAVSSAADYAILVKVAETASGSTFKDYIQQSLFKPLGIQSLGRDYRSSDLPVGLTKYNLPVAGDSLPEVLFFPNIPVATVEDLYKLIQEFIQPKVLSKSIQTSLLKERVFQFDQENTFSMNAIGTTSYPNPPFKQEQGIWGTLNFAEGYSTTYWLSLQNDEVVILSENRLEPTYMIMEVILKKLHGQ